MKKESSPNLNYLCNFKRLSYEIRPCDVILIAGRSRISQVIKTVTQSHWSHSALYIGRLHDIESERHRRLIEAKCRFSPTEQLIIETEIDRGTVISPLSHYENEHLRICRPKGIHHEDAQFIINYCIEHIGKEYDVRQILDLGRFLFPWSLLPKRWRSSLFQHNAGYITKEVCSTLIAKAFAMVNFPILPHIRIEEQKLELLHRNPRLFTPSDFDFSPYFEVIKYPFFSLDGSTVYRNLPWNKNKLYHDEDEKIVASKKPNKTEDN